MSVWRKPLTTPQRPASCPCRCAVSPGYPRSETGPARSLLPPPCCTHPKRRSSH
tara:strand:- start:34132 stop:34293 length:162 start_codon:yes stop_codon:yes gene_type:complete